MSTAVLRQTSLSILSAFPETPPASPRPLKASLRLVRPRRLLPRRAVAPPAQAALVWRLCAVVPRAVSAARAWRLLAARSDADLARCGFARTDLPGILRVSYF